MFQQTQSIDNISFFKKISSLDYTLIICILTIGIISCFAMYSTDGGEILYHTKSHLIRFVVFFIMMIVLSFLNIKFWHSVGYLFYIIILLFLFWASFYGVTASGSQRWINLYIFNLQPSELMKIAIIWLLYTSDAADATFPVELDHSTILTQTNTKRGIKVKERTGKRKKIIP